MIDPFTIIATTSAVISFSQFAGNIVLTAYSLYNSAADGIAENETLEDATSKLKQLLDDLSAAAAAKSHSSQDKSIIELANTCRRLGEKILKLLEKTKAKRAHSVRESIRAATVTVWTKRVVDNLRKDLEFCTAQLGLHLQAIIRSETGKKLRSIMDASGINAKILSSLKDLLDSVKEGQELELESLNELREIFSQSKSNLESMNRERILKGLEFQDMGARFMEVSKAARETFEWIVHDSRVPESCPDLKIPFQTWLRHGNGVFHITGKPGAGKSTLMKFIVDHRETKAQLKEWAGTKTLVVASFFFWKPGKPLQRSLEGLIRSLVHSILTSVGMKNQCFCFFIDGLDEFDDPDEKHAMLAERLQTWADLNPDGLKICVSSREENAFLNQFSPQQRVRLRLLTEPDIRKMTTSTLERHPRFRRSTSEDREKLIDNVVSRSQGVFLWVKLDLNEILENLDELLPSQSLQGLYDLLETIPEELCEFFTRILASIRKQNRAEAWTIFALVTATHDSDLDMRPRLIHYSFVGEFSKNKRFGIEKPIYHATVSEIKTRLDSFKLRLNGLCKGLIEPINIPHGEITNENHRVGDPGYWAFKDSIDFTHRSFYEFLQQELLQNMKQFIDKLEIPSVFLQCFLAQLKFLTFSERGNHGNRRLLCGFFRTLQDFKSVQTRHFEQLAWLEDVFLYRQCRSSTVTNFDWSRFAHFNYSYCYSPAGVNSPLAFSCYLGFQGYVAWAMDNRPDLMLNTRTRIELVSVCMSGIFSDEPTLVVDVLRYLLERGFSTDLQDHDSALTVWESYVKALIAGGDFPLRNCVGDRAWEAMKVFLNHDVDPHFSFFAKQKQKRPETENQDPYYYHDYEVSVTSGQHPDQKHYNWHVWSERDLIIKVTRGKYREISLREIVEILRADDTELLDLIDRNLALHKERARLARVLEPGKATELEDAVAMADKNEAEKGDEDSFSTSLKSSFPETPCSRHRMIPLSTRIFGASVLSLILALVLRFLFH